MRIEDLPDGFKLTLGKNEVYRWDKSKGKWFQGRKEVPPEGTGMFKYIVGQLEAPKQEGEETTSTQVQMNQTVINTTDADLVKTGKALPKVQSVNPKQSDQPDNTQTSSRASNRQTLESQSKERDGTRVRRGETDGRSSVPVKITNLKELGRVILEALDSIQRKKTAREYSDYSRKSQSGISTDFGRVRGMAQSAKEMTDTVQNGGSPTGAVYGPEMPEIDFGKVGRDRARKTLDKMSDLTPGERELLKKRGVAPASEKDMFYRKDGKTLSKKQLIEELGEAHAESPFKQGFKARMREKNPLLRYFTNAMEDPEDIAKGRTPRQQTLDKIPETFKRGKEATKGLFERVKGAGSKGLGKIKNIFSGTKSAEKVIAKEGAEVAAKTGGKAASKGVGKIVAKEGAEVAAKVGGKALAKVGGKALGKSLLKKIPGVGLVAGLGFGAGRLMSGDWKGALGEVASGAASTVPGIGTAASVAIDAGLAARDMGAFDGGDADAVPAGPQSVPTPSGAPMSAPAEPIKAPLTPQTQDLAESDAALRKSTSASPAPVQGPTIINNNNNSSGGGSGGDVNRYPTASPRGSLETNYFAF